jgi:phosphohistidine phosphatase
MKRLFLIRHATALPRESSIPDFERSLIPKGIKEAKKVAKRISKNGQIEGVLISSPANRALETAHIFAKTWDYPVQKIILKQELYDYSSGSEIWTMIQNFEDDWHTVMLFGHDPSLSELAGTMAKGFKELMPKSGALGFSWNAESWKQVTPERGRLILLEFPKSGFAHEKIHKSARKELAAALSDGVSALLAEIDPDGAADIKKRIRKSSQTLASDFLGSTKHQDVVLSFWLRSRQKANVSDNGGGKP